MNKLQLAKENLKEIIKNQKQMGLEVSGLEEVFEQLDQYLKIKKNHDTIRRNKKRSY